MTSYRLSKHITDYASIAYDLNLHTVCAVNVLLNNEQILDYIFQTVVLAINKFMKL